jgi:predicted RNA-binding Zn-ribbon protein involved in translation (DUF1610 family)
MGRCPNCGNEIYEIVVITSNRQEKSYLRVNREGEIDLDKEHIEEYYCPICRERLFFDNVEQARDFLKG